MDTASILTSNQSNTASASADAVPSGFRSADFLKVMLSELSHQDPMAPQETSKIVEGMQKLQDLANTQYTKFRNDVRWAQDLIGTGVTVQQQTSIDPKAKADLISRGVNIDEGFGNKSGEIKTFKVIGESVYVHVGEFDYPVDNIRQVAPRAQDPDTLSRMADQLMGREVGYWLGSKDKTGAGVVTNVGWDLNGDAVMTIDGKTVPYANVTSIGIPTNANAN